MAGFVHPEYLVETDWLDRHRNDVVVLDCTTHLIPDPRTTYIVRPGREDFENGHIPGAQFCDVSRDVSDTAQKLNFMRPQPDDFAAAMRRFGISNDTRVVTYSTSTHINLSPTALHGYGDPTAPYSSFHAPSSPPPLSGHGALLHGQPLLNPLRLPLGRPPSNQ